MVPSILAAGSMTDSMVLVLKSGVIMLNMKVTMKVGRSKGLVTLSGVTVHPTWDNFITTIFMGPECICGRIRGFMRGIGATCPTTTSSLRRRGWSMGEPGRGDGLVTVGIGATTRCSRVARRRCLLRSGPLVVGLIWGA